jgi:hypothetical protein
LRERLLSAHQLQTIVRYHRSLVSGAPAAFAPAAITQAGEVQHAALALTSDL